MTIQSSLRKAGPFLGDASNTAFPFSFKVFTAADVVVTYLDTYGVESTLSLTTDYTLTLNSDQDNTPGGMVNMIWTPAIGTRITLTTAIDYTQTLELTNSGGFYPASINNALDRIVVQVQQIYERIQRTLVLPLTSTGNSEIGVPSAGQTIVFDATGSPTLITASTGTSLANLASSTGSAIVGYTQGDSGAIANTVQAKQRERISVKDFGADATGTLDATSAFSLCAKAGTAIANLDNNTGLPSAPTCVRYIPAGTYKLTQLVNVGYRHVIWVALGEVRMVDASGNSANKYLNGRLHKEGQVIGNNHFGIRDYANTLSLVANNDTYNYDAQVDGFASEADLNKYYSRDSVTLYVHNECPPCLLATTTASYTATTVTISAPSADVLAKYRAGMVIDTQHSPKYSAILKSWNTDGSVLTVNGWYQLNGSGTSTPPGTTGIVLNPITKIWGQNTTLTLPDNSDSTKHYSTRAAGYEMGIFNQQSRNISTSTDIWGFDCNSGGNFTSDIAYYARGDWYYGFKFDSYGAVSDGIGGAGNFVVGKRYIILSTGTVSFTTIGASTGAINEVFTATGVGATGIGTARQVYGSGELTKGTQYTIATPTAGNSGFTSFGATDNNLGTTFTATGTGVGIVGYAYAISPITAGFAFTGDGALIKATDSLANTFFQVSASGNIVMGNQNIPAVNYIDFHSSGNTNYDARIIANGGNTTIGQATLSSYADSIVLAGVSGGSAVNNTSIKLLTSEVFTGGTIHPLTNNSINLGTTALRWANIYSFTTLNVSSDQRLKQDISVLSDAEKRVAVRLKSLIRTFRFKDAVALKGDAARIHTGVIAQDVQSAFNAEGLDGFKYGLLCYDAWPATDNQPAGDTYGIRYEELLAFIIAGL